MVATKLWSNPCRISFRLNFLAHHFNQPLNERIQREFGLSVPEYSVLFALGLSEGITAEEIAGTSSSPKNTLSRAVNSLLLQKLVRRERDDEDRRRLRLYLTEKGRSIVEQTRPWFVEHEEAMFKSLDLQERETLVYLMTKVILSHHGFQRFA